mgnify:CR=1
NKLVLVIFFFNPIRIIYYIESLLVKKYESFCFKKFTKILLHSKREIDSVEKKFKGKLAQFSFGVTNINKKY